jgi:hypothetical protein
VCRPLLLAVESMMGRHMDAVNVLRVQVIRMEPLLVCRHPFLTISALEDERQIADDDG